jgi:hypothetical protein
MLHTCVLTTTRASDFPQHFFLRSRLWQTDHKPHDSSTSVRFSVDTFAVVTRALKMAPRPSRLHTIPAGNTYPIKEFDLFQTVVKLLQQRPIRKNVSQQILSRIVSWKSTADATSAVTDHGCHKFHGTPSDQYHRAH